VSVSDWVPIASVVASGAVGLGVPYVVTRHERRDLRADVLRRAGEVERLRWAPADWDEYRQAIFALRGAALVAGANREIVDRYIYLAHVARRASKESWEEYPVAEEGGGAISGALADLVTDAATMLAEHLWHPFRKRPMARRLLKQSHEEEATIRRHEAELPYGQIDWTPYTF
jgi:hypothetical protein